MYSQYVLLACVAGSRLAAAHTLRGREDEPEPDPPVRYQPDCTEVSFSYPIWDIYEPRWTRINASTGGKTGDFGFAARSLATGITVVCYKKNINLFPQTTSEIVWNNCNDTNTRFWPNLTANTFELRQSWSCNSSNNSTTNFDGDRTAALPVSLACFDDKDARGNISTCLLADLFTQARLLSPIELYPMVPWFPYEPYYRLDTCVERSEYASWGVEDLVYDHTAPRKSDPSAYGLSFNLTNWGNDEKIACRIGVDETVLDRTLSERWVDCENSSASGKIGPTSIMFNREYGLLGINQTWKCDQGAGAKTYNGVGFLTVPFNCTTPEQKDAHSTQSYTCALPTKNVTGWDVVPAVPHTYYTRSCTIHSLNSTALTLRDYEIESAADGRKLGSFTLLNPGPGDEYRIRRMPAQDDGQWHDCARGDAPLPWQLVSCQYSLDRSAGSIGFRIQWYCDDRNPENAILFNATASGHFSKEQCRNSSLTGVAETCRLSSGPADLRLEMAALTWKTTPGPMDRGPILPWA